MSDLPRGRRFSGTLITRATGLRNLAASALILASILTCSRSGPIEVDFRPGRGISARLPQQGPAHLAFSLAQGEYLELLVDQAAGDLTLVLRSPGEQRPLVIDTSSPLLPRPPERLRVVAARSGRFDLAVSAQDAPGAAFQIEVVARRPATSRDRRAALADDRLAAAEELRRRADERSERAALPLYEQAAFHYQALGDAADEAYVRIQEGRVLRLLARPKEAASRFAHARELATAAHDTVLLAKAFTELSAVVFDLGRYEESERLGAEALALWRQLKLPASEAQVENQLANQASERGELSSAEERYLSALAIWQALGRSRQAAMTFSNLASIYSLVGDGRSALDMAEKAVAKLPEEALPAERAAILEQRGEALAVLGRDADAERDLKAALDLYERAGQRGHQRRLGRFAYERGRYRQAAAGFRAALESLGSEAENGIANAIRQDLASSELRLGHLDEAERLFAAVLPEARARRSRWVEAAALAGRAQIERRRGRIGPALAGIREALRVVEDLRIEAGRSDLATWAFADGQSVFDRAVDLLVDAHRETGDEALLAEAFGVSERSRARRLLDLLGAPSPASRSGELDPAAQRRVNQAEERLGSLRAGSASGADVARAEAAVREGLHDLRRREETPSPRLSSEPLRLAAIRSALDRDIQLLEFDLGEEASYLWVVSQRELAVFPLPARRDLEPVVARARQILGDPGGAAESVQGKKILADTSRLLLGGALAVLRAPRWWVVADGTLHALPIGALPDPLRPERPILEAHEVVYAPSASVAVRLAGRSNPSKDASYDLALFADAIYSADDPRLRGTARARAASAVVVRGPDLPALPGTLDEAQRILAMVPPSRTRSFLQFEASKERVLSGVLTGARLLHFAVHGLPNDEHAELSTLVLSRYRADGRPQDGALHAFEIARLDLHADLVVLSACQSGEGPMIAGEGLVGLAHAFLTAGAARVVVSDWPVQDQATAELMGRFYDGLLSRRLRPSRALQEAQLSMLQEGPWRRPYHWAGFVVQGGF